MVEGRWFRRLVLGLRPDRNPLRRRTDRVETFIFGGLLVTAATAAPIAAVAAGHWAYTSAVDAEHQQQAARYLEKAVLLRQADGQVTGLGTNARASALARWTTPAGTTRTGEVPVLGGAAKGATFLVWTDSSGTLTTPPLTSSQAAGDGAFTATGAAAAVVVACLAGAGITRFVMNRRRLAAWETAWEITGPMWNRQSW